MVYENYKNLLTVAQAMKKRINSLKPLQTMKESAQNNIVICGISLLNPHMKRSFKSE